AFRTDDEPGRRRRGHVVQAGTRSTFQSHPPGGPSPRHWRRDAAGCDAAGIALNRSSLPDVDRQLLPMHGIDDGITLRSRAVIAPTLNLFVMIYRSLRRGRESCFR